MGEAVEAAPAATKDEVENDENDEGEKGAVEEPIMKEGKRKRKAVEKLDAEIPVTPKKAQVLVMGDGDALSEIEAFVAGIKTKDLMFMKKLHRLLYNSPGSQKSVRNSLRKFKGFVFADKADETKKMGQIEKLSKQDLFAFCSLLGVAHSKDKQEACGTLMTFLKKPSTNLSKPPVKKRKSKAKSPAKPAKKKKGVTKKPPKKKTPKYDKDSYYANFIREERARIEAENTGASETEIIFLCGAEFGKKYEIVVEEGDDEAEEAGEEEAEEAGEEAEEEKEEAAEEAEEKEEEPEKKEEDKEEKKKSKKEEKEEKKTDAEEKSAKDEEKTESAPAEATKGSKGKGSKKGKTKS